MVIFLLYKLSYKMCTLVFFFSMETEIKKQQQQLPNTTNLYFEINHKLVCIKFLLLLFFI